MEPIESSETSASNTQTPGNYPKERKPYLEHGENLKSRISFTPLHSLTEYDILTHLKHMPELRFFTLCHRIYIDMIMSTIILYCKNIREVGMERKCGPNKHKVEELMSAFPRSECLDVIILSSN
jgi:hypothetical protein